MAKARFSLNSVRARLALWNVGVLAFVLIGLGVVFSVSMRANIAAAVDHHLAQRAHRSQRHFSGMSAADVANVLAGRPRAGHVDSPPSAVSHQDDDIFGELHPRLFNLNGEPANAGDRLWDPAGFARAAQGDEVYATVQDGADVVRVLSVPLKQRGNVVAVLETGNSLAHLRSEEARTTRTLLTLIPVVLIVAGIGGVFLTDRALRPVRRITQEAEQIEAENLSSRLPVTGDDEFADLAETFNGMLARLQSAFERQEEAFEQQRRFTADASHELRTPLTIIKANTSLAISGQRTAAELKKTLQTVDAAADRMNRIVQDLLLIARSDVGQLTYALIPTSLADVVNQALLSVSAKECAPVNVALTPQSLAVMGHNDALIRLFSNLLENACRYTPLDGNITITAQAAGDRVVAEVIDTGIGIAPEHLPHLTERFYRVEAARSRPRGGTGLGLAICRSIVEAHHGDLTIESRPGAGTTVRIMLPGAPMPASTNAEPAVAAR